MTADAVDAYLAGLEEPKRSTLEALRQSIRAVVPDAEECIARLVAELVFSAVDPLVAQQGTWQQQVTQLARRARTAITAHPAAIPLLLAHHQHSPSAWRWLEALLSALTQAGLTSHQQVIAVRCLRAYLLGAALNETLEPLSGPSTAALASLSPAAYPLIAETAPQAPGVTPEQEFEEGLAIILHGLDASLPRSGTAEPG